MLLTQEKKGKRENGGKPTDKTNNKGKFAERVDFSPQTQQVSARLGISWPGGSTFITPDAPAPPRARGGDRDRDQEEDLYPERPESLGDQPRGQATATRLLLSGPRKGQRVGAAKAFLEMINLLQDKKKKEGAT